MQESHDIRHHVGAGNLDAVRDSADACSNLLRSSFGRLPKV